LKIDLKKWNEEVFGNVERKKRNLLEDLRVFDEIEEGRALGVEKIKKAEVVSELETSILMEEVSWRQKSRVLWLKEGDKCTKFFHSIANSNRRNNSIDSLLIGGKLSTNQAEIRTTLASSIKSYSPSNVVGGRGWMAFPLIPFLESEACWLERDFGEEEVRKVVTAMAGDKAPGPDGFSMAFFQACWEVLRMDIMKVLSDFHARGKFEKSLNASFITLIPKIPGAIDLKDFARLVLWGVSTKLLLRS
jgi:hypothetical protein